MPACESLRRRWNLIGDLLVAVSVNVYVLPGVSVFAARTREGYVAFVRVVVPFTSARLCSVSAHKKVVFGSGEEYVE